MPNKFDYYGRPIDIFLDAYTGDYAKLASVLRADPAAEKMINSPAHKQTQHTPLFFACYGASNAHTVGLLLTHGADPSIKDWVERTAFHYAANSASVQILDLLVKHCRGLDTASDVDHRNLAHALFMPAQDDSSKHEVRLTYDFIVEKLGDDSLFKEADRYGYTAYDYAFEYYPEIAKELDIIYEPKQVELDRDFFGRDEILRAAFVNNKTSVRAELENAQGLKSSINYLAGGRGLLHLACGGISDSEMVEILLQAGVDPLAKDFYGSNALHFASNSGRLDTVSALLQVPIVLENITALDDDGNTALHTLALSSSNMQQRLQVFDKLVEAGLGSYMEDVYKIAMSRDNTRLADHIWFKMKLGKASVPAEKLWNYNETFAEVKSAVYKRLPSFSDMPKPNWVPSTAMLWDYSKKVQAVGVEAYNKIPSLSEMPIPNWLPRLKKH